MTNFVYKKPASGQSKKGAYLGSMRNLQPGTNGVVCSPNQQTEKVSGIFEFIDKENGEILRCSEGVDGALKKHPDALEVRLERWILQSAAKKLLPEKRVSKCLRLRAAGQDTVNVMHNKILKSAHYAALQTCGSVWDCPCCAAKISERRRLDEVKPAMDRWVDQGGIDGQGGQCLLLTLTHSHSRVDVLVDLLKGEQKAMSRMTGSRAYKKLIKFMGCIGTIRAWECTHRDINGFHPHFHIILFVRTNLDLVNLEDQFYLVWSNACRLAGLPEPDREHGVKLDDGNKAQKYLTKGVWGLDHEITKGHIKKSNKGRSPYDLLRSYAFEDDKQAGALFVEYSKAFHGKSQLYWSPGLKEYFKINEKTDEEVAGEQDEVAVLLGRIEWPVWKLVLKMELRGEIIELGRLGAWDSIVRLLDGLVAQNDKQTRGGHV